MAAGAHSRKKVGRVSIRLAAAIAAGVVVVVTAASATYAVGHRSRSATASHKAQTAPAPPPTPLRLLAISPQNGADNVAATTSISVRFSARPAAGSFHPTITPAIPGTWTTTGSVATFKPAGGFTPYTTVSVRVPAGVAGTAGTNTLVSTTGASTSFTIAPGSVLRLQQLLAELGYLPVTFTPTGGRSPAIASEPTSPSLVSSSPVAGVFTWRFANTPTSLTSEWVAGQYSVMIRGAVMAFESDHGLAADGSAGPQVWGALLNAVATRQVTTREYTYLMVSESEPETLQVWANGQIVASSPCNTGVAGAPTATGTYPVYARYQSTTMSGTVTDTPRATGASSCRPGALRVCGSSIPSELW
jgi:peptidoglycan hydrolase-like protein with peptidoglycan-binding domain